MTAPSRTCPLTPPIRRPPRFLGNTVRRTSRLSSSRRQPRPNINTLDPFFYSKPYYFIEPQLPECFKPLSDEQWRLIYHIFPPPSTALGGRPCIDERRVLDGILFKFTTGYPWYDLPEGYPSWQTCYRRFRLWLRQGILHQIFALLYADLRQRGGVDLVQALKDGRLGFEL